MKPELQELLTDFKAAARIGAAASLEAALEQLRGLPEVAGNPPLSEGFLQQAILPLGAALSHPRLASQQLAALALDPNAAVRAIAAVALAPRYFTGDESATAALLALSGDKRPEVRQAMAAVLATAGAEQPEALLALATELLGTNSPRTRALGLMLLAPLGADQPQPVFGLLAPLAAEPDEELRAALAETLLSLADHGQSEGVLAQLEIWAEAEQPNSWVITRTLSGAWAAAYGAQVLAILRTLAAKGAPEKHINRARKALARHGVPGAL